MQKGCNQYTIGEATVSIAYPLMNFQLVVLVQCTHSTEKELKVGTSIEARMILSIVVWTLMYRRSALNTIHSVLILIVNTSNIHYELQKRNTQQWDYNSRLPINLMRSMQ